MIDGLGRIQSVMLVGATSEIGGAILARLASRAGLRRVVLVGRPGAGLDGACAQWQDRLPSAGVESLALDLVDTGRLAAPIRSRWADGEIDIVIVAAGVLPDPEAAAADPAVALDAGRVNFLGPLEVATAAVGEMSRQGHGTLVVLSSVAAERPRRDNFVYGATKAALDAWANGAADALHGSVPRILVVRPGMVRTSMSAHLPEAPMTCDPDDVARAVVRRLHRGPTTIWVPSRLRWLMAVLRHLPRPVFRRLSPGGKSTSAR